MFLVSYFAVLSKKTYKGTTKNAHTQAKWEIICKKIESLINQKELGKYRGYAMT